jgi:O-antigen/teichoic acid export membrane protein
VGERGSGRGDGGGLRDAVEAVLPRERFGDQRDILGGAAQNVAGLAIGAVAAAAAQVLMSRTLGEARYGIVTLAVQLAFVGSTATRFGMDVANIRLVAILVGRGEGGRVRGLVRRSTLIALCVSLIAGLAVFALSSFLADRLTQLPDVAERAFQAAALALPLAAMTQIYLGATRGLKIMRHTLYVQWIGQPLGWIALTLLFWLGAKSAGATVLAYAASWGVGLVVAVLAWERESAPLTGMTPEGAIAEERTGALVRFGAFRAPAALFSHLVFWADFYVFSTLAGDEVTGVYAATLQAGQTLFLFLTSLSLMFSPFVADLHHRGEHERLDSLYKSVTRWALAATLPVLTVLIVMPGSILRIFGAGFAEGREALLILVAGMIVPVCVGTVGFILIMVGRTGWDLAVYVGAIALDVTLALALARPEALGIRGAAIAQAVTLACSGVARLLLVRRFVRIWPFDRHFLRLVPAAAIGAAVMAVAHATLPEAKWLVNLVVSAALGTGAYAAALLAFGLTPGERRVAIAIARRAVGRGPDRGPIRDRPS